MRMDPFSNSVRSAFVAHFYTSIVTATGLTSLGSAASAAVLVIVYPQNWDSTAGGWLSIGIQGAVTVTHNRQTQTMMSA